MLKGADIKNSSFFAHVKSLNRHNQRPPGGYGFGVSEENDGSMSIWKFVRSLCCIDRSRIHETTEDEDSDNEAGGDGEGQDSAPTGEEVASWELDIDALKDEFDI